MGAVKMKSFLGWQEVKEKYLARVAEHRERDELVHGTYWSLGKGCGRMHRRDFGRPSLRGTRSSSASLCGSHT